MERATVFVVLRQGSPDAPLAVSHIVSNFLRVVSAFDRDLQVCGNRLIQGVMVPSVFTSAPLKF